MGNIIFHYNGRSCFFFILIFWIMIITFCGIKIFMICQFFILIMSGRLLLSGFFFHNGQKNELIVSRKCENFDKKLRFFFLFIIQFFIVNLINFRIIFSFLTRSLWLCECAFFILFFFKLFCCAYIAPVWHSLSEIISDMQQKLCNTYVSEKKI